MSKLKHRIIWEKWKDPFGSEPEDDISHTIFENRPEDYDNNDDNDDSKDSTISGAKEVRCKIIVTPFGAIPYTENTASSKIFNFWTGHANFSISKSIAEIIEDTEGVETLDIFTRYRFRISVGKAFQDSEVMRSINSQIYSFLE